MGRIVKPIEIIRPFIRNGAFPIDSTVYFNSYEAAVRYAQEDPNAIPGVITVDDPVAKIVGIYVVDYAKSGQYTYDIHAIETTSASGTGFNWKGSVSSVEALPDTATRGDIYLVTADNNFYVAYDSTDDEVTWAKLSLNVTYASYTEDGIIRKEVYTAMSNQTNKDAIWFSSKDQNVANNKWIEFSHTTQETQSDYKVPSVGVVRQMINTSIGAEPPHADFDYVGNTEQYVQGYLTPTITIHYYPESAGVISCIKIYRSVNDVMETTPIQTITNPVVPTFDTVNQCYNYTITINNVTYATKSKVEYKYVLEYKASTDGSVPSGVLALCAEFNFYNKICYGTNNVENTTYCKGSGSEIKLTFNPYFLEI